MNRAQQILELIAEFQDSKMNLMPGPYTNPQKEADVQFPKDSLPRVDPLTQESPLRYKRLDDTEANRGVYFSSPWDRLFKGTLGRNFDQRSKAPEQATQDIHAHPWETPFPDIDSSSKFDPSFDFGNSEPPPTGPSSSSRPLPRRDSIVAAPKALDDLANSKLHPISPTLTDKTY